MSRVFLIRHGQASWGKRNYDVLSDKGIRQSHVLGTHIQSLHRSFDAVVCGHHQRHKGTAKACMQSMHLEPKWSQDVAWNEFDFQNVIQSFKPMYKLHSLMMADLLFRKKPQENFRRIFEQSINEWMSGKNDSAYKETWLQFTERSIGALESLKDYGDDKDILVFTSGGVISVITCYLLGIDLKNWRMFTEKIVNTSITQVQLKDDKFSLVTFNEHSHLLGDHQDLYSTH